VVCETRKSHGIDKKSGKYHGNVLILEKIALVNLHYLDQASVLLVM